MGTMAISRHALSICVAAAMLAGCGGSQPPIGAPCAMPQAVGHAPSSFRVLHGFGRSARGGAVPPRAPLLDVNGTLYGTTLETHQCHHRGCGSGTVFSISTTGAKKVLYIFKGGISDGAQPAGALIDVNGTLYGTTAGGGGSGCGGSGCGTVYSISTSGSEKVLYSFKGGSDGADPVAGLTDVNGTLYGTTSAGGSDVNCTGNLSLPGCGTVYSISTSGSETVLYAFASIPDGAEPISSLIDVNGTLYGTTGAGGVKCGTRTIEFTLGCGTVYSITTSGSESVLYRFKGRLAEVIPTGGLLDVHGMLYGTTGNPFAPGSVYKISLTGAHKVVYYFQGVPDGAWPTGGLISVNGLLYGTTQSGGVSCVTSSDRGCGTVFSVTTSGKEAVLHSFTGKSNGAYPHAVTDENGSLYGTALGGYPGCDAGCGIVFALSI